jgi:MoaA/NifB/PqqE/SkfB family radical SAM enzyme
MSAVAELPLVTLYLTERCNSRCVTCDYWRHGRIDMSLERVRGLLPSLLQLRTRVVLVSGGEPLLNPDWAAIAGLLRAQGIKLWLLTSGLSLAKHARVAVQLFDWITVSLDGTSRATYEAIRGLDAFDVVSAGMRAVSAAGAPLTVRTTLQRANYRELATFVALAHELGAQQLSFLAVDVANPHAFGRTTTDLPDTALAEEDLAVFDGLLQALERDRAEDFRTGFIAESPAKLRRILAYFAAIRGRGRFPAVRCNAPEFSAVVDAGGGLRPCFFIPGPADAPVRSDLADALNAGQMRELRANIRAGARPECATCVCPLWRDLAGSGPLRLSPRTAPHVEVADACTP